MPDGDVLHELSRQGRALQARLSGLGDERARHRRGRASNLVFSVSALAYLIVGHERHHLGILAKRYGV